jgi:hypothetical protein
MPMPTYPALTLKDWLENVFVVSYSNFRYLSDIAVKIGNIGSFYE